MLKKISYFSCLILLFLTAFSCKREKAVSSIEIPQHTQAIITFTTGDVLALKENQWNPVEINDFLETGDTVKVEADSYCEIQFGNRAVIKIEENTELVIPSLQTAAGSTDVGLKVLTGAVLSKVNKLTSSESFTVETQSAACGVRGTEFMVRADNEAETLLAVKEGSVIFIPAGFDVESLKSKIPSENTEVLAALSGIESALSVVKANEEIAVHAKDMEAINASYAMLEKTILYISENQSESASRIAEIKALSDDLVKSLTSPAQVSDQSEKQMQDLDLMVIRELPEPEEGKTTTSSDLVKVSVSVNVPDARISRDGRLLGKGKFSAIYSDGEEVSLLISGKGYLDKNLVFKAGKESENIYEVTLEKNSAYKETATILFKVAPDDAEIIIDGTPAGTGSFSTELLSDKTYNVLIKKEGYQKKYLTLTEPKGEQNIEVTLLPSIEKRIKVSTGKLTGYTAFSDNRIFTADIYGEITCAAPDGTVLWKLQTGNSPNESAFPVASGKNIFFSGANEFITADMKTGTVKTIIPLDDDSSHVFGRRVIAAGNTGIYPANSRLLKFSLDTGDFNGEIEIPDGTRMTPGTFNNELLIVNQKGVFYRINPSSGAVTASLQTKALQPVVNNVAVNTKTGKAVFNGKKGEIVCINLSDNSIAWTASLTEGKSSMITGDLQIGSAGVYAYSQNRLYGFSAETGKKLFDPVSKISSPPVLAGGRLYFGTTDGFFKTADALTGSVLESINILAVVSASPWYDNGKIYAGTDKGEILVLNP